MAWPFQYAAGLVAGQFRTPASRRALASVLIAVSMLLLAAAPWACRDFDRREESDWKAVLALAQAAWQRGDRLEAQSVYLRAARIASWKDDWEGILAAACGMKRLEDVRGYHFNTRSILVLAMISAERSRSAAGLRAVADAFITIGEQEAAAMVLSKVEPPRASPSPLPARPWSGILSKSPGQDRGSSRRVEPDWGKTNDDSFPDSGPWDCSANGQRGVERAAPDELN